MSKTNDMGLQMTKSELAREAGMNQPYRFIEDQQAQAQAELDRREEMGKEPQVGDRGDEIAALSAENKQLRHEALAALQFLEEWAAGDFPAASDDLGVQGSYYMVVEGLKRALEPK